MIPISVFRLHKTYCFDTCLIAKNRKRVQHFILFKRLKGSGREADACPALQAALLGLGESHPVVVPVEDGVVLTDEHVSQDPQGAGGGGNVQTHEATQT